MLDIVLSKYRYIKMLNTQNFVCLYFGTYLPYFKQYFIYLVHTRIFLLILQVLCEKSYLCIIYSSRKLTNPK